MSAAREGFGIGDPRRDGRVVEYSADWGREVNVVKQMINCELFSGENANLTSNSEFGGRMAI